MASEETNDRKRIEMSTLVFRLRGMGWTNDQLAVWMGVTTSTVRRWFRAESMGTNDQRAQLARLGTPRDPRILEAAALLEVEAVKSEEQLAKDRAAGAAHVAKSREARIARIRQRANDLRRLFPRL